MVNVKRALINPNASNSLILFLIGSIIAGFSAGLGWGLATKILEKSQREAEGAISAYKARRAGYPGSLRAGMR